MSDHEPILPPLPEAEKDAAPSETAENRRSAETLWRKAVSFQQQKRYEEALAKYGEGLTRFRDPLIAEHAEAMEGCIGRLDTLPHIPASRPEAAKYEPFNNWNKAGVENNPSGPLSPTRFTISRPHATLKAGMDTVFDSHPPTCSHNAQSDLRGFVLVKGRLFP